MLATMESGNVSTPATITTGSFQSQPPAVVPAAASRCTRKRGISTLVQDITNTCNQPLSRRSALQARKAMKSQSVLSAPRGNPAQGGKLRHACVSTSAYEPTSLLQKINDDAVFCSITENLAAYTQRHISFEVQKAIAINIMATAVSKWNCGIMEAVKRAADCCGFNAATVRLWASEFATAIGTCSPDDMSDECITDMLSSNRGIHDEHFNSIMHNEDFRLAARQYVRKHACRKGEPNLTSLMFAKWVETECSLKIHDRTARKWLTKLGFSQIHHQKGVYFDGHDRSDVVAYRNEFLKEMDNLDKTSLTCYDNVPRLTAGERPLIRVVHDECTFYANSDQSFFWGDDFTNVLRQKSLGASIMVSDFIDEVSGFVRDEEGDFWRHTERDTSQTSIFYSK